MNTAKWTLLSVLTLSIPAQAAVSTVHKDFNATKINLLEVHSINGNIAVMPETGDAISVDMTYDADKCEVTSEVRGKTVYLEATDKNKRRWFSFGTKDDYCAKFDIKAPAGMELKAVSVSGDIATERKSAPVSVETVSGDVNVSGPSGLEANSVSGELKFSNAAGKIRLNTTSGGIIGGISSSKEVKAHSISGDIKLEFLKTPEKGELNLNTTSGDVSLIFPKGARAAAALHSVSGEQKNNIINDPTSGLKITATTVSGDTSIDGK
ncbi:MAG: hypothetical protein A2X28_07870 [Elusimicrobia bacterium GWA2_56_46]|nr:MAG: hypothetical protein A2X28_07870 [Elusimicrobia bacterium GWA2_56_46]OGR53769.1 MAG: hypothetical protein A2X39_06560 [Elusimicrobia bacterium GWC2_56_31]HBB65875.1 hypothetical protein [Elusimicrobiota bacterium]HBW22619.1 hypothetical protein [Elusimicrobiota bacterium]